MQSVFVLLVLNVWALEHEANTDFWSLERWCDRSPPSWEGMSLCWVA